MQPAAFPIDTGTIELPPGREAAPPLVVDLDGTLTPIGPLYESLIQIIKCSPISLPPLPFDLVKGNSAFKDAIAGHADLDPSQLPCRHDLLDYLRSEKAKSRPLILATAAHMSIAKKVADYLGLFDKVLATESGHNLKGIAKLQSIRAEVGRRLGKTVSEAVITG
ncbi:MAG TPA: hypothetical protein PLL07_11440 [Nitrosomonas sp.]|nr:hypothetical protein [Nitrosomonas sp.]